MSRTLLILATVVFLAAPAALSQDATKPKRPVPPHVAEALKARARAAAQRRATEAGERKPETKAADKTPTQRPRVKAAARSVVVHIDSRRFAQRKRTVYHVKHLPAQDLANTIVDLLKTEARTQAAAAGDQSVALVADPVTNTIIISADPEVVEEVVDLVERIDRQPALIHVRTLIAEITAEDAEEGDALVSLGMATSVSKESIDELAAALQKRPGLRILARPQLMALDNQPAFLQIGQRVPRVTGRQVGSTGRTNYVSMENVGLILALTARVNTDGLITMEIDLEQSHLGPVADGVPVAVGKQGDPIRTPSIDTLKLQTTISAASGQTVSLGGLVTKSGSRRKELILLVSPEIVAKQ